LNHCDFRRLPFYLTFACVVAVLCSVSASNWLIAAAVVALLACHFRFGDALRFPPVKLPLGLFFLATLISVALSGHIREGWPGPRKFYLCFVPLLSGEEMIVLMLLCALSSPRADSLSRMLFDFIRAARRTQAQERKVRAALGWTSRRLIPLVASGGAIDYIDPRGTNFHAAGSTTISCFRTDRRAAICAALGVGRQ
jgi:hypothetical protein